jgi:hypothetical protein
MNSGHKCGHAVLLLLAIAAITLGMGVPAGALAQGQASAPNQTTGTIVGSIKLRGGSLFEVDLAIPGADKPIAQQTVSPIYGPMNFSFKGIPPGTYKLDVNGNVYPECGIIPWSKIITIHAGETLRVKVKMKVNRHAICE